MSNWGYRPFSSYSRRVAEQRQEDKERESRELIRDYARAVMEEIALSRDMRSKFPEVEAARYAVAVMDDYHAYTFAKLIETLHYKLRNDVSDDEAPARLESILKRAESFARAAEESFVARDDGVSWVDHVREKVQALSSAWLDLDMQLQIETNTKIFCIERFYELKGYHIERCFDLHRNHYFP